MKHFSLEEYQKNPSRKVITRDCRNARILCTDRISYDYPVVALVQENGNERMYSYTKDGFTLDDQQALADCAQKLAAREIPVVISNHDTELTQILYAKAKITSFNVQRFISSNAKNRNAAAELIALYD